MNAKPSVRDPEMDMIRAVGFKAGVRMSHVLAAMLRWLAPELYAVKTPRRSVDRELEQFSPPRE